MECEFALCACADFLFTFSKDNQLVCSYVSMATAVRKYKLETVAAAYRSYSRAEI